MTNAEYAIREAIKCINDLKYEKEMLEIKLEEQKKITRIALKLAVKNYECVQCPVFDCSADIRGTQKCIDCICETYIKQATDEVEAIR